MARMAPRIAARVRTTVIGHMKLAALLSMGEEDAAGQAKSLEAEPLFRLLRRAGAVTLMPFPAACFAARRMAGRFLASPQDGLGELLDGRSDLVDLMRRVGEARLKEHFLGDRAVSDSGRARACGLTLEEARELGSFIDRLYIRTEFEPVAEASVQVFSAVAGIGIVGGKPELRFFHREVWSKRYKVDRPLLSACVAKLDARDREAAARLATRLELFEWRKTTLYRALEALISAQARYLLTGDPSRRQPLTQRSLAAALGVDASSINRLISNKSVELPWGLEAPMKALLPSAKSLCRETVFSLAQERPGDSDESLRTELSRRHQIFLSRRSVAQYRKELGLAGRSRREARGRR